MRGTKFVSVVLLATLLLGYLSPISQEHLGEQTLNNASRSTGIDLKIEGVAFSYVNSLDQQKYQMFSSNGPITGRPDSLFVIDTVVNVPIQIEFEIKNLGSSNSGNFNANLVVSHNEYNNFELHNESIQINSINGGGSTTAQITITPKYSGNHSLLIYPTLSSSTDDNPANDDYTGTFTVASNYYNCDDLTSWNVGSEWGTSIDTFLSQSSACHMGKGQSSTYSNNLNTALITPVLDMSDSVQNPLRTNGITFFYTGSILQGDILRIYINDNIGVWNEIASVTGTVDQVLTDGANWQTWSVNNMGHSSPLIPVQPQFFHSQTQFKFEFTSDASNNDIGIWIDEIVIVYDQKVKPEEFGLNVNGVSSEGTVPESWGKVTLEITNTGNITETFIPSINGLPNDWNLYYSYSTGVSINPSYGITLNPGEKKQFDINFQPDVNATIGLYQITFTGTSSQYSSVKSQLNMQLEVLPDRIPLIQAPVPKPSCQPGNTCVFTVAIDNIGGAADVFDLSINTPILPLGWSVAFAWSQSTSILSTPGITQNVLMTFTVPSDAVPDSIGKFDLVAKSQNDTSRVDIEEIELTASMISIADISMNLQSSNQNWSIIPGESRTIYYTVWNNATSQDVFVPSVEVRDLGQWIVEEPKQSMLVINSGKTSAFSITITAPEQAQLDDICPKLTPVITSSRSGAEFSGLEFDGIEISRQDDLVLRVIEDLEYLQPGTENRLKVEIENNGNGPAMAKLEIDGIPSYWEWHMEYQNQTLENPIYLSAIYDLEDIKQIDIVLNPPSTTLANDIYQYSINVKSSDGFDDYNDSDNIIELVSTISTNNHLVLSINQTTVQSGVGNDTLVTAQIENLGNVFEGDIMVRAKISTLENNIDFNPYFTISDNGLLYSVDKYHKLSLDIGDSAELKLRFSIPEFTEVGTQIIVSFEVQSISQEGPQYEVVNTMVNVDYRRSMDYTVFTNNNKVIEDGNPAIMLLNLTSKSTVEETYTINAQLPNNWQVLCGGIILNETGYQIEMPPGHINEQFTSIRCEIFPLSGNNKGEVIFSINNSDMTIIQSVSRNYEFEESASDSFSISSNMIAGSIAGILGTLLLTIVMLRRKRNNFTEKLEDGEIQKITPEISGPPVSGPPIQNFSNQQDISTRPNLVNETQDNGVNIIQNPNVQNSPPIPSNGLPEGWTHEQWAYYGQRYLDNLNKGE